ncbi:hypothetical protein [Azospirillum doebereinerae]
MQRMHAYWSNQSGRSNDVSNKKSGEYLERAKDCFLFG